MSNEFEFPSCSRDKSVVRVTNNYDKINEPPTPHSYNSAQGNNKKKQNQYLFFGKNYKKCDKAKIEFKQNTFSDKEMVKQSSDDPEMHKHFEIKSLGDALIYFRLACEMKKLETSLEDVRRNKKTIEDHEECFKQVDKEIQKLSFQYHPDKVVNRGGREEDVAKGQVLQSALNSTRTALKLLNSTFIADISIEHKFEFYTQLRIDSFCNEDEMKSRIYEVIFKMGVISRIKQQNIISEIRKFLTESKICVRTYLENSSDFEKHQDLVLYHLKCCVKGFKKLYTELVKEQRESETNGENIHFLLKKMANDCKRDLSLLKSLKKTAKISIKGDYRFFSPNEDMDPYFVLPLVSYINVILMCDVMVRGPSVYDVMKEIKSKVMTEGEIRRNAEVRLNFRKDLLYMIQLYYLASYCSGNRCNEKMVLETLDKGSQQGVKIQLSKMEIENKFRECTEHICTFMESKFRVEDYNEAMPTNLLMLDLKKCMTMMAEFEKKEQDISKSIEEFQKKAKKMEETYGTFVKIMEETEELNRQSLEQSKRLFDKVSSILSDKQ